MAQQVTESASRVQTPVVMRVQPLGTRRPYIREVSKTRWYFRHARYMRYMAREVTCIFIAAFSLMLVVGFLRLAQGPAEYEAFLAALRSPECVGFLVLALGFSTYHSVTWFNLAPKALRIEIADNVVPAGAIALAHYAIWIVLSGAVLYFAGAF